METPKNWIPDTNRFNLAQPPDWFLKKLWDFDDSLVIVPSRQDNLYRLAQRRPLSLPIHVVNEALFKHSDTKMLATYGLIPVTSILPTIEWSDPYIFVELRNRAPHRLGGAKKVIEEIEAKEDQQELEKKLYMDSYLNYLGKDAWGLYNKKLGVRSHMYIPRTKSDIVKSGKSAAIKIR